VDQKLEISTGEFCEVIRYYLCELNRMNVDSCSIIALKKKVELARGCSRSVALLREAMIRGGLIVLPEVDNVTCN
jgi:hypothetical protein